MSMPTSACWRTTCLTASASGRSVGRGVVPAWDTRMRSVLRRTAIQRSVLVGDAPRPTEATLGRRTNGLEPARRVLGRPRMVPIVEHLLPEPIARQNGLAGTHFVELGRVDRGRRGTPLAQRLGRL